MKLQKHQGTIRITGLRELCATNAHALREQGCAALNENPVAIEIDLSRVPFIDSVGLGALTSLHHAANRDRADAAVAICLLDPSPAVRQVIELTRMDAVFQIVYRQPGLVEQPGSTPSQASSI